MSTTTKTPVSIDDAEANGAAAGGDVYVVPVVGARVPGRLVNVGFWGGLTGAVLVGAIDPPLGILLGAGVVIARHQTRAATEG